MKSHLATAVCELLRDTTAEDWRKLSEETEVPFAWIRAVALGRIDEPGPSRLETLHIKLTGKRFPNV